MGFSWGKCLSRAYYPGKMAFFGPITGFLFVFWGWALFGPGQSPPGPHFNHCSKAWEKYPKGFFLGKKKRPSLNEEFLTKGEPEFNEIPLENLRT